LERAGGFEHPICWLEANRSSIELHPQKCYYALEDFILGADHLLRLILRDSHVSVQAFSQNSTCSAP
jgi:hypothetical protein